MSSKPLADPLLSDPLPRWRRRLIRAVDLVTVTPRYRRLHPARQIVRDQDFPRDREAAIAMVSRYCAQRGLCQTGTARFIQHVFELDRPDVGLSLVATTRPSFATPLQADPELERGDPANEL